MLFVGPDGHVVSQLGDTFVRKKSSDQNIRVGQIELAYSAFLELGLNLETAAALVIEERREHGGRIEIWKTEKIDRAVHPYQRNRAHVADHAVVLNWFEAHACKLV